MKVALTTLGCKVNAYDTEAMSLIFSSNGYEVVNFEDVADIYVINTCTVTNVSDKKSRQMIRRAKSKNKDAIIVAAGCYAQVDPEAVSNIEGVNIVVGTKQRQKIVEIVEKYAKQNGVYIFDEVKDEVFENLEVNKFENRTRAYLKIQDGCNQYCSYCIIPYARGNIRSRKLHEIAKEAENLSKNGFKEVVVSGIHVASYGKDLENTTLLHAVYKVHEVSGIKRIRFSSLEPTLITKQFISEIKAMPKICDHFHLSLQSGCNKTLLNMNRKYTTKQYEEAVYLLRNAFPNVSITTDMIVGFPKETEEDFLESYCFAEKIELSKIHVFPYSPKKGTAAFGFSEQVPKNIKEERAKKLIKLSDSLSDNFRKKFISKKMDVLFETKVSENVYEGYTTNYIAVRANSNVNIVNEIITSEVNF